VSEPATAPAKDEAAVLALADELGYWPSYRQVKRLLGFGSERASVARNGAEPYWDGRDTPTAALRTGHPAPVIIGVTADEADDPQEMERLWAAAIEHSQREAARAAQLADQRIVLPPEPFALALLGDTHVGDAGVDYEALQHDARIISETPGMYAVFGGDATNNWVMGKLQALARNELMSHTTSWRLFLDWFDTIGPKWVAAILGNHDAWTHKVAGFDPLARHLRGMACLYGHDEMRVTIECGSLEQRWKIRHKWRYGSVFNPTHPIEVGWERGDDDFDVGVGFHTHNGTLVRDFFRHGVRRYAVQLGAYKVRDAYGMELGLPSVKDRGCGAMVGTPDGLVSWHRDLGAAAEYLAFLRG
jgi:hypothetical protein